MNSPARCGRRTPSPTRLAKPSPPRAVPDAINELFAAYDRLTPADLMRVAAQYFQPGNDDGHHPGDGDQAWHPTSGAALLHSPGNPLVALHSRAAPRLAGRSAWQGRPGSA